MTILFLTGALIGFTIILLWLLRGFKIVFTNANPSPIFFRLR